MTPETDFFGRVEAYCLRQLDSKETLEFEAELKLNEELREEVRLEKEIQAAITQTDILDLRGKLEEIDKQTQTSKTQNGSFDLLDEFSDIHELSEEIPNEELINFYDSLPKVHVYQHEIASNENLHQFYKEQNEVNGKNGQAEELNGFDFQEFEGIEEALLEKDILDLRDTLAQVAKSVEPQYSVQKIDEFINNELRGADLEEFELELAQNSALQEELGLHLELEEAVVEDEVMNLRDELTSIMNTETSWNVSTKSIEEFIEGIIEDELLEEFSAELKENTDLMAEVKLREQVNKAIGENDIRELRAKLANVKESAESTEIKSLIPDIKAVSLKRWRTSVAMILLLIGLAGAINTGYLSVDKTYDNYFETPVWASERSVSADAAEMQKIAMVYAAGDYDATIEQILATNAAIQNTAASQFFMGASHQQIDKYQDAVKYYSQVIHQGDNLFIEEAEWYRSLCYMKLGKKKLAKQELLAVIERKGYYEEDARAVLRRIRYSFK